ncbi:MAG: hypothetical protein K1X94_05300 [Sandaracinaceae bacterium]|jgi:hypothetical protein|nr:hypothetical protein [Sandaracinaceae bacterium]
MISLTNEQARDVGSLGFSLVEADNPMLTVRAAQWRNSLARVGLAVPFWCVHDLGLLLVHAPSEIRLRRAMEKSPLPPEIATALEQWRKQLVEIAQTEMVEKSRAWKLSDALVVVVLLRVLGPVYERHLGPGRRPVAVPLPVDPDVYTGLEGRLQSLFTAHDRRLDASFLYHLVAENVRLLTSIEQIDLDTLRLLGMFGAEATAASAFGAVDLLNVLESPDANDVVNFSLDLLPSVLETRRATGAQTFAADGYAGLARRGSLDSLMLSELAYDEDLFDQRYSENEVFYYSREKTREDESRCHYLCVDTTASMRGQRSVFARGLALTLIKKLQLRGEDVFFRFFDSRLYELHQARAKKKAQGIDIPYVLSFKGEHGRNYAKVFGLLANEVSRLAKREKKSVILYIVTHAECHVPLEAIERLRASAQLYGIFMLPSSGELDLEYLPRLHKVQIVTQAALEQREERAKRAMDIVDDAAGEHAKRGGAEPRASIPPGRRSAVPPSEAEQRASDLAAAEKELGQLLGGRP